MLEQEHDNFVSGLKKISSLLWSVCITLMWAIILSIFMVGSASAIVLLIKLYPDISLKLFSHLYIVYAVIFKILWMCFIVAIGFLIAYLILRKRKFPTDKMKERREIFKKELIKEIKGDIRNGRGRIHNTKATK